MKKINILCWAIFIFASQRSNSQCLPVTVSAPDITQTTAEIWLSNHTAGGTYYMEYGLAGFTPGTAGTAGAGGTLVAVGAQNFITVTSLTAHTTYHVYCRKNCSGTWSTNSSVYVFTTAFDCSTAPSISCGTLITVNHLTGYGAWNYQCQGGAGSGGFGTESVYSFTPSVSGNHVLLLPSYSTSVDFSFKAASGGCNNTGWTCIGSNYFYSNQTKQWTFGPLTAGTPYYINADAQYNTGNPVSAFRIECPFCSQPTSVSASNISTTSALISWFGPGSNILEYGPPNFVPGTNSTAGGGTVVAAGSGNQLLTNLAPSTAYDVYIRTNCGSAFSPNSFKFSFSTKSCPPVVTYPNSLGAAAGLSFSGTGNYDSIGNCFPVISMPGQELILRFTPPSSGNFEVTVYHPALPTFNYVLALTKNCKIDSAVCQHWYDANPSSDFYLIGPLTAGMPYDLYFDVDYTLNLVGFTAYINCPKPSNITTIDYQPNSIAATWSCNCNSTNLEYGPPGFTPGTGASAGTNGTLVTNATSPYIITGLQPLTYYDIYLRSNCGGNFSTNTTKITAKTGVDCSAGQVITCSDHLNYAVSSSTPLGAWQNSSCSNNNNGSTEKVFRFTPSVSGTYSLFIYRFTYSSSGYVFPMNYYYKAASGSCNESGWSCIGATNFSASTFTPTTLTFGPLTAGVTYLILADGANTNFQSYTFYFRLDCPNVCSYPSLMSPTNVTLTGAQINAPCPTCFGNVYLEYGQSGFTPGTNASPGTGGTVIPSVTFPVALSGLTPEVTYDVYSRTNCGSPNGFSSNSAKITFTTCSTAPTGISSTAPGNMICTGSSVTLTKTGGTLAPSGSYKWYTGFCGGTLVGTGNSITVSPAVTTNYLVRAEANCGNSACAFLTITVNAFPAAAITPAGPTSFCSGGSVILNANTGTGLTHQWKQNNSNISGATNSSYTATASGSYTVTVSNSGNCSATSSPVVVTVNGLPNAAITPAGPATFCSGGSVVLNAVVAANRTYQWKKGTNIISGATLSSYTATSGGNYRVIVTNTATGCSKTTAGATVVTVNALPAATITPQGPTTFCAGGSVVLAANSGTGLTYKWKKNNSFISGATLINYTATAAGTYKVQVTNSNGCSKNSPTVTVSVPCKDGESVQMDSFGESESEFDVKVFPNPSSGDFIFEFVNANGKNIFITVYDMIGKKISFGQFKTSTVNYHVSNLSPGIYTAEIICGENIKVLRLISTE